MDSYTLLSKIYDLWQEENDTSKWADYIDKIIARHCKKVKGDGDGGALLLLDLGCGTGSFAAEMANRGYDVLGMDCSSDMLAVAKEKGNGKKIQFIQQDMTGMELFGTVDIMVCLLDTVNHILKESDLHRFFGLCKNYLNPGGLLIFDLATPYYFKEVLSDKVFYDIREPYTLIWQNHFDPKKGRSRSELTFFIQQDDNSYIRGDETIQEKVYSTEKIEELIIGNNLDVIKKYSGLTFQKPSAAAKRIFFVVENKQDEWKKKLERISLGKRGKTQKNPR